MNSHIDVTARRWEHGWELHMNGEVVTQVSKLVKAEQQVRDYLDSVEPDIDHSFLPIRVIPDLGPLGDQVVAARAATEQAAAASVSAARQSREVVRLLRQAGLSVADSAAILGVSRGRISQLVKP